MANTTNFGWETPDDTDLVKDGASAMRTLGNAIDTSLVDLKGGTTGQVLSKASNTDMDFTWVAQDDSNAIQNAIVDAKGDLISASAADTPARLASSGVNGDVLTVDTSTSTGLKWAAPASGVPANDSATVTTQQTTTSTSYTDLTTSGPAVTVTTGTKALVIVTAQSRNNLAGEYCRISYAVSGSTTVAADDSFALNWQQPSDGTMFQNIRASAASVVSLTAGSNTFTLKYRVNGGTGTFLNRAIFVINLA